MKLLYLIGPLPFCWEFVQSSFNSQPVQNAFAALTDTDGMLAFLQTPEFRLLITFGTGVVAFFLLLHLWSFFKLLMDNEAWRFFKPTTLSSSANKQVAAPPSQIFHPDPLLWENSRIGLMPSFLAVEHPAEELEATRGESTPTRGGDLP